MCKEFKEFEIVLFEGRMIEKYLDKPNTSNTVRIITSGVIRA